MRRICVYCGSNAGAKSAYQKAAYDLGCYLADNKIGLVYGGSDLGLMGILANSVLTGGGKVTAVMPEDLRRRAGHKNRAELIVVENMHQRKQKMFEISNAFIALPGGFGTLDEMFEMLTWGSLGYHNKPCGFLNIEGYFDHLLRFMNYSMDQGFVNRETRDLAFSAKNIFLLMQKLKF